MNMNWETINERFRTTPIFFSSDNPHHLPYRNRWLLNSITENTLKEFK